MGDMNGRVKPTLMQPFPPSVPQPDSAQPAPQHAMIQVRLVPGIKVERQRDLIFLFLGAAHPELGTGMKPEHARTLAKALTEYADQIDGTGRIIIASPSTPLPPPPTPGGPHVG